MGLPPLLIQLQSDERKELERLAHRPSTPQQLAQRMRIVILAADGLNNAEISQQLGVSTKMVRYWRRRWKESEGDQAPPLLDRLSDRERPGAPMKFSLFQQVDVLAMACRRPEDYGIESSQWTARMLRDQAVEEGIIDSISVQHIRRWLNEADLKPHQIRYWLFPPLDPEFEEKSVEICNCYLNAIDDATQGVRTIYIDEGAQQRKKWDSGIGETPGLPHEAGTSGEKGI